MKSEEKLERNYKDPLPSPTALWILYEKKPVRQRKNSKLSSCKNKLSNDVKLHVIWKYLLNLRYPLLMKACQSLTLSNPSVKEQSCACQFFLFSIKSYQYLHPLYQQFVLIIEPASVLFYRSQTYKYLKGG